LERWADSLKDYEDLKRELPGDEEVARALSEVQLGFKKSLGEKMNQMWYGGNVEDISSNDQFREAVSHSGTYPYFFSLSSVQELPSFAGSCAHNYYGSKLFHHKT
jgi:DnaJ family protein C protein 7